MPKIQLSYQKNGSRFIFLSLLFFLLSCEEPSIVQSPIAPLTQSEAAIDVFKPSSGAQVLVGPWKLEMQGPSGWDTHTDYDIIFGVQGSQLTGEATIDFANEKQTGVINGTFSEGKISFTLTFVPLDINTLTPLDSGPRYAGPVFVGSLDPSGNLLSGETASSQYFSIKREWRARRKSK
jgi:hypothetical protein